MIHIDGNEEDVIARFALAPSSDLNTIVQVEEIFTISREMGKVFSGVVGVRVETEEEIYRGLAMARAARHGDLLSSSPVAVEISGSDGNLTGYLFSVREELWLSITARRLNFRLLSADDFENCVLSPQEIKRVRIAYDEHGFFEALLEGEDRAVLSTGALCEFYYGAGPAKRPSGSLERPGNCAFQLI